MTTAQNKPTPADYPVARATPLDLAPVSDEYLQARLKEFKASTVGERYFGPSWVSDLGVACIVLVAHSRALTVQIRREQECTLLGWRWNGTSSTMLSLTLLARGQNPPHARWICDANSPVVAAMRREERFYVVVASQEGSLTGWMEARFFVGFEGRQPSTLAWDSLWTFEVPGIPFSKLGERFDPMRREPYPEGTEPISLWPAPSDVWCELSFSKRPWDSCLQPKDHARGAWAYQHYHSRCRAAGMIHAIIDRQALDGVPPVLGADGAWLPTSYNAEMTEVFEAAPALRRWLMALAGPSPSAKEAYDICFEVLSDPPAAYQLVARLAFALHSFDDYQLAWAASHTIEAVLLDERVTDWGTRRPWLENVGHGLALRSEPLDLTAPLDDIREYWRIGLDIGDLLDAGPRLTPHDFPVPFRNISKAFDTVKLEGTVEDAEATVARLLSEAQAARQWSIPWGARVEVAFGPFVAMRIFEDDGEFSCHFLDAEDRYFQVAIGLDGQTPRASTKSVYRFQEGKEISENEDAEASLKLIAAAVVRDFVVVESRASVFSARNFRKRIRGRDVRTVIYLPRVRYDRMKPEAFAQLSEPHTAGGRAMHHVAPHLRRAENPTAAQLFLAKRYGIHVPEGFTFVRGHDRGGLAEAERVRVYRSRSASRMIFTEMATAPTGSRPAWFDFEKDCLAILEKRGLKVIHQAASRDGDGGVDLYAVMNDGACWVIQCKCWAAHRKVGPEVVRELAGAIQLAARGSAEAAKGIVITTSSFTSGAVEAAVALGYELIDGQKFASLVAEQK